MTYKVGDRVRIAKGKHKGITGIIAPEHPGNYYIVETEDYIIRALEHALEPIDKRTPKRGDWVLIKDESDNDWSERIFLFQKDGKSYCVSSFDEERFKDSKNYDTIKRDEMKPLEEEPIPCPTCGTELKEDEQTFTDESKDGKCTITAKKVGDKIMITDIEYTPPVEEDDKYEKCVEEIGVDFWRYDPKRVKELIKDILKKHFPPQSKLSQGKSYGSNPFPPRPPR